MKLILWGGIIFLLGSIFLIAANYKYLAVDRSGNIVRMRIEKLPNSCLGTKAKHFTTLSYNNEQFVKKIGGNFCDTHNVGELVDVKYLEGSSVVLFPGESVLSNIISFGILGLLGLGLILYYGRKHKG